MVFMLILILVLILLLKEEWVFVGYGWVSLGLIFTNWVFVGF